MSPDGWAATISNGHGPPAGPPHWRSQRAKQRFLSVSHRQFRAADVQPILNILDIGMPRRKAVGKYNQRLLQQRHRLGISVCFHIHPRQIIQVDGKAWMIRANRATVDITRLLRRFFCQIMATLRIVHQRQTVQAGGKVGIILANRAAVNLNRSFIRRLGQVIAPLRGIDPRKIVKVGCKLYITLTNRAAVNLKRMLIGLLGQIIAALCMIHQRQIIQRRSILFMIHPLFRRKQG